MIRDIRTFALTTMLMLFVSASPAMAGVLNLAWDPNPETSVTGYRVSYGTQPGSYPTTIDVGKTTAWQVRGLPDGKRYYFVVRAYVANGAVSPPSAEVSAVSLGIVSLGSDYVAPSPTGKPITWTAQGSSGGLEYRFYRFSEATGEWAIVRDYAASNTYTWTPAAGQEGRYALQAWARLAGASEDFQAHKATGTILIANTPLDVKSLESSIALPSSTGTAITWKAQVSGGPAPVQYQFWRLKEATGTWTMVRDYSTSDSYSWTPASHEQGRYAIQVWARAAGSGAAYDAWRSTEAFEVKDSPTAVATLLTETDFPAATGTPITWKATAAGGPGPLQYRFYRFSQATNAWSIVQDYSTSNTYAWTPNTPGTYAVQVWVRRSGSTADFDAYGATGTFVIGNSTPVIKAILSSSAAPFGSSAPVTFTVDATGGSGALQFKFLLLRQDKDSWTVLRDYSAANNLTWTFGPWDAGDYALQAWVRRAGSTAAYEAWASLPFSVRDSPPIIQSVVANVGTSAAVGTPVTLTVLAAGGPGPLEYAFNRFDHVTQAWVDVQKYSWDDTLDWVPTSGELGSHTFEVLVRRSGSTAAYEAYYYSNFDVK